MEVWVEASVFQFEIHQGEMGFGEQFREQAVHLESGAFDFFQLVRSSEVEFSDVFVIDHGIAQGIVLVVEFDDWLAEFLTFGKSGAFGETACHVVANDEFYFDDLNAAYDETGFIFIAKKVGGDALGFEHLIEQEAEFFIDGPLSRKGFFLHSVERRGVVFELHQDFVLLVRFVESFGFAFVDQIHG